MSRQKPLSTASVRAALERLKALGALSSTDLTLLHDLAGRLDRDTHRARVADVLAPLFPEVREAGRENAFSKLVLRLNQAQDAIIEQGRLSESFRLGLKAERKNIGPERRLWFVGKAQTQAQPRLHDLDAAQPLYENTTLAPELVGRAAKGAEPILLLTVTERETEALYRQFSPEAKPLLFDRDGDPYALLGWVPGDGTDDAGRPRRRPLIAYRCRMGALRSGAAILRTQRAIQHLAPQVVIAVGIAFGDRRAQALGDVLVAEQVETYESARHNADGSRTPRSDRLPASSRWLDRSGMQSHTGFAVRKGLMLCGEALLDNPQERARLNQEFPTAIGGDMESFGMATACHESKVDWLVIKGVSDWGDGTKSHGSEDEKHAAQSRAAQHAARVAYSAIHLAPAPVLPEMRPVRLEIALKADGVIVDPDVERGGRSSSPRSRAERVRGAVPRYEEEQVLCGPLYDVYGERLAMGNDASGAGGPSLPRRRLSEADATRIDEAAQTIHQTLLDWLRRDDAPMLFALLGEYGMGKTVSCQRLSRHLAEARASEDAESWMRMPVYFDLRNLSLFKGSDRGRAVAMPKLSAIVDDLFERGWRVPTGAAMPGYDDLREWLGEGALLILDGLDECLVHLEEAQHPDFLRMLMTLVEDAADATRDNGGARPRLLISCRTNFFKTLSNQRGYFTGDKRGRREAEDYESRVLLPLTDAQIAGYIASAVPDLPLAAVQALIDETHDLRELAERPMTLKLLADYIPDLERVRQAGGTVNGAYLYGLIARDWLQRDEGKHHLRPEHKLRLMPALAAHLWRSGVRTVSYAELHTWFHAWRRAQDDLADLYAPSVYLPVKLEEDLRTATFVVRQDAEAGQREGDDDPAPEGFRFAHTSMQEYFLAVYLADAVCENRPEDWAMAIPSPETLDFLAQQLELAQAALPAPRRRAGGLAATLSAWAGTYRPEATELLLKYALHARTAKVAAPVLPDLRGADVSGARLRGWRFGARLQAKDAPLLDLSRVRWAGADLRESDFAHVRLDDGDFSGAQLDLAAFQHCSAQRCDWRQSDLLGTVFRHCRLEGSRWQPLRQCHRPKLVACTGVDGLPGALHAPAAGEASARSTLTRLPSRLRAAIASRGGVVRSVALSADGGRVVSGSDDGTVRVWDASSGDSVRELRGH
ncbi:MAG: pentapeptide repeat-containing protein, partial [Pseudomonadota bacterium]